MCLIQPLKFRTLKMGCFKMPRFKTDVFQMGITVASGHTYICFQLHTEKLKAALAAVRQK